MFIFQVKRLCLFKIMFSANTSFLACFFLFKKWSSSRGRWLGRRLVVEHIERRVGSNMDHRCQQVRRTPFSMMVGQLRRSSPYPQWSWHRWHCSSTRYRRIGRGTHRQRRMGRRQHSRVLKNVDIEGWDFYETKFHSPETYVVDVAWPC